MSKIILGLLATLALIYQMLFSTYTPSPTVDKAVISSNPVCEYELADRLENWLDIRKNTIDNQDFMRRIAYHFDPEYNYSLEEALMIEVLPYNTEVIWHFMADYTPDDQIYMVLVTRDGYDLTNVVKGSVLEDGTVLFNFDQVLGGTYYMFLFVNQ